MEPGEGQVRRNGIVDIEGDCGRTDIASCIAGDVHSDRCICTVSGGGDGGDFIVRKHASLKYGGIQRVRKNVRCAK